MQVDSTIEERLAALEAATRWQRDQIEIRQVIASYGPLVDVSDRLERSRILAELWTEDGIYDIGGVRSCQGRDAIAKVFEEGHFDQVREGMCHVMGLPHVHIDGDTAVALNYSCVMRPEGTDRFYPWRVSANKWEMVRQEGKWLIQRRTNRLMTGDADARAMLEHIDLMLPA